MTLRYSSSNAPQDGLLSLEKIVVHEKEAVDGQIIMRVDIHNRFIGKVGSADGGDVQAPKIRRSTKLLAAEA